MGSNCGEDSNLSGVDGSSAHEEKILVSVRLRPLNEREVSQNDESDWECINNTIISKSNERAIPSTGYNFDRVFGSEISSRQVYEEGAKNVALSALNGINASIFAYGQTSSGKTYTMSGITEYTLSDIFNYVNKHESREFVLKFSALEIYNECVRDLLTSENTNLRLLDDPERGTVVAKLTEVTLRDWDQLKELLAVCEAQRQIGETTLNEMSSRSHQILRLTIESSTREYSTSQDSDILTATVNFVDLAGSERSSQSMSESTRLKEGCHINRSLLTLGTVIRKLSKGRNGHVPYRDSKLTRILQNSLGGNAKTAIICTLSPAQSHVEQSRNTLLFASCAKQVTNSAQVNVVMSEKTLVKLLQKELARLEKELRRLASVSSGSCDSLSALQEKERQIEKMDNEIRELTQQRDYAHSRLQNVQLAEQSNLSDSFHEKGRAWLDDYPTSVSDINDSFQSEITSSASHSSGRYEGIGSNKIGEFESEESFLSDDMTPTKFINKYFGPDPSVGWENIAYTSDLITEDICKEVQHVEVEGDKCRLKSEEIPSQQELNAIKVDNSGTSKIQAQDLNNTSDCLDIPVSPLSNKDMSNYRNNDISRNRSCEASITIVSSEATKDHENVLQNGFEEETPEMVAKADNLKVVDELNHDSEKLEDREDKTETSNEENIDQHNDYSTTFREDYDLKDEKGEDNSRNTFFPSTDGKLECLHHDENFVGNLECQKQSVDNPLSDASSNEDESRICQKQIVYNHVSEDENLDFHKQIVDTHVNASTTEDENLECQKQVVEKHVSEDENLDCHKQNVDKHISEDEILECRNQIVKNHVNEENLDCHKQIAEKQISEDEILECQKPSVDNHVTQDENLQCQKHIVDNHLSVVSSPDHENLQCEKHLVDNPTSVVVSSINSDHFQCDEEKSKGNHVVQMERTSEKQQNLPDNDSKVVYDSQLSSSNRTMDFEKQRQEIIELWNVCNVPLEHRTYFFLLFKGEPSDSIYMEVEQRRLSYLKGSLCRSSVASSQRALQRERERLKRQMLKKLSSQERESLYEKWGIALKSKKRRLQLCRRLWTNTKDLEHIKESAALVAKLVGFEELNHAPKEIFGLSLPPPTICRSITWQGLPSLLRQLDLI